MLRSLGRTLSIAVVLTATLMLAMPTLSAFAKGNYIRDGGVPGGSDGNPWNWDSPHGTTSVQVPLVPHGHRLIWRSVLATIQWWV
jgi:hypothetical protein